MIRACSCAALLFAAHSAHAEDVLPFQLEAGVSTFGVTVAPTVEVTPLLSFRAPISAASLSFDYEDEDGNDYDVDLEGFQGALMADFHPWRNGFRISGGIALGGYSADGVTTDPVYGGLAVPGDVRISVDQKHPIAPIVSIGYSGSNRRGVSFFAEIGAKYAPYEVSYATDLVLTPAQRTELEAIIDDITGDVDDYSITPFASIGLTFSF